jgi:hypothetical protein
MKIYTQGELKSKVERIIRVAGKVDGELHNVLCSILTHTEQHGDYTQLVPLLNGLNNGVRKQGIVAWLKNFSGDQLIARKDPKTKSWVVELAKGWDAEKFDLQGAYAVTYGDFAPEPEPTTVTLAMLIKMLEKKAVSTEVNKDGTPKVTNEARIMASRAVAFMREEQIRATG